MREGERLKQFLMAQGISQAELARQYRDSHPRKSSAQYISQVVQGPPEGMRFPAELAGWLMKTYRLNLNWLFGGEEPMILPRSEGDRVAESPGTYRAMNDVELLVEVGRRLARSGRSAGEKSTPEDLGKNLADET